MSPQANAELAPSPMMLEFAEAVPASTYLGSGYLDTGTWGGTSAFEEKALGKFAYATVKRCMDVAISLLLLVLVAPLMLLVAAAIKLSDFGPVLFVQTRVGRNGRVFRFYKFRSMVVHAEQLKARLASQNRHQDYRTFKMHQDPRITHIGRLIRVTSIDELPQLWNVLKGDMSLVGPRPPVPEEVALYSPRDRRRLEVAPGLTCIWQVAGRSNLDFEKQVRMDVEYIENQGLWLDLALLARTVPAVITRRGAY